MDPEKSHHPDSGSSGQGLRASFSLIGTTFLSLFTSAGQMPLVLFRAMSRTVHSLVLWIAKSFSLVASRIPTSRSLTSAYALGGASLIFAALAGSALAPSPSGAAEAIALGGLRIFWAIAVFWLAERVLKPSETQAPHLRIDLAYSMTIFVVALNSPLALLMTIVWAVVVFLRLRSSGYPAKERLVFAGAALGVALSTVVMRWIGEYVLILLLIVGA